MTTATDTTSASDLSGVPAFADGPAGGAIGGPVGGAIGGAIGGPIGGGSRGAIAAQLSRIPGYDKAEPYLPGRREALFLLGGGMLGAGTMKVAGLFGGDAEHAAHGAADRHDEETLSAKEARTRLIEGNERFVKGASVHPDMGLERRAELKKAQHPFATILSCADSRVPPELLFDQGLGDLFVVRSAGHVVDQAVLGSLQYGIAELGTPLLVVLGHSKCGAVKATIESIEKHAKPTGTSIDALVRAITPAVHEAEELGTSEEKMLGVAVDLNVELVAEHLKQAPVLAKASLTRQVKVLGAVYSVSTGEVEWL